MASDTIHEYNTILGVVHILHNQPRGEGGWFPNDYGTVIWTQ